MSDQEVAARHRTASRLRGEAPLGLEVAEFKQTIGRYEIVKTLGRGAMGVVYKARDPLLDRVVAVKTIVSPQGQGKRVRSAYLERFQREAKAAAKMQHPAIVTIFDIGIEEESGAPFMVLEYLPGETLADRLDKIRMPLGKCVQVALDLGSALAFAHRQRIVHRDVKPANVLHAGENRWKLADFGIARMPDSDLTQAGIFMGTPGYSPPEAIREGRYTPQADVFAWGAVLYEMLCGRIPYEGPDTKTTNSYVVRGEMRPPTVYDASIPKPLVDVCMNALEGNAGTRYRDAAEAEAALRTAWDACLTQGLVHPAVLAMEETPHDRAPAKMHAGPGAGHRSLRDDPTVDHIHGHGQGQGHGQRGRSGDDDPTTVIRREDLRRSDEHAATTLGVDPTPAPVPPRTRPLPAAASATRGSKPTASASTHAAGNGIVRPVGEVTTRPVRSGTGGPGISLVTGLTIGLIVVAIVLAVALIGLNR